MQCPCCQDSLYHQWLNDSLSLVHCRNCEGHWLRLSDLAKFTTACKNNLTQIEQLSGEMIAPNRQEIRYRTCPECGEIMNRRASISRTFIVDYCASHGIWFDCGELQAVARFSAASIDPRAEVAKILKLEQTKVCKTLAWSSITLSPSYEFECDFGSD